MRSGDEVAVALRCRDLVLRAGRSGDAGLVTSAVVVCVAVGVVALLMIAVLPLLAGTDRSARTQTASDAAALAGATGARDTAVAELRDVPASLDLSGVVGTSHTWRLVTAAGRSAGLDRAQDYAWRNDAVLERYDADADADRVSVTSRGAQAGPGGRVQRTDATARVGVQLASCRIEATRQQTGWTRPPTPSPTPTPTVTPSPVPTPSPSPTFVPEPIYGPWSFSMSCAGSDAFSVSAASLDALVDRGSDKLGKLRPRLVS